MVLSLKIGGCPIALKDITASRSWSCHVCELHKIGEGVIVANARSGGAAADDDAAHHQHI